MQRNHYSRVIHKSSARDLVLQPLLSSGQARLMIRKAGATLQGHSTAIYTQVIAT